MVAYFLVLVLKVNMTLPATPETVRAVILVGSNLVFCISGYLLTLLWISQFVLPVRKNSERRKAFNSLLRYTLTEWLHGPAIFVKGGEPRVDEDELNNLHAGVAFVDLNSAIVLEQQLGSNDSVRQEIHFESSLEESPESKVYKPSVWRRGLEMLGFGNSKKNLTIVNAFGPGIVFTKKGQKIVGWADIRKQSRTRLGVQAGTRDGIEVATNISVSFTLGQPEDILQVTKVESNWFVVQPVPVIAADLIENTGLQQSNQIIKLLSDQLSDDDIEELNRIFDNDKIDWLEDGPGSVEQKSGSISPFIFDRERVFAAVYSRARNAKDGRLGEWTELPFHVAAEAFRTLLAHENYNDLYLPDDPGKLPISEFKGKFGRVVRNMGILGYQIIKNKNGLPLRNGQAWNNEEMIFSVPARFQSTAVLRDRGIKVLSAGFSDLVPAREIIRTQLFENWRAHWERETQKTLADHELRTIRIHNHERSRTQQDMIYSLSRIFQENQYTTEALAIRLYQALEAAAISPATQRLLPGDTIQMLSNLRQWLLPEDKQKNTDPEDVSASVDDSL